MHSHQLRWRPITCVVASTVFAATAAFAGGGPENVAVIVNGDSWASQAVANEYVALRDIPSTNVIVLNEVPDFEMISVEQFRASLLQPVIDQLTARGVAGQIDIIAWSCDFPWAIDVREDARGAEVPQIATPTASLTGLTYLYEPVLAKHIGYLGMASNFYYRRANVPHDTSTWTADEQGEVQRAVEMLGERRNLEQAEVFLARLAAAHPQASRVHYNHACALALLNRPEEALAALTRAVEAGWADAAHTAGDQDLASLRDRIEFEVLLETMRQERIFEVAPSIGFRHEYAFDENGAIVPQGEGVRYVLSTMLAVTSGRGLSVEESLESLRRSVAADGTRPQGTFYYMRNRDVRSTTRAWGFPTAIELLRELGLRAEIVEGDVPRERDDVLGIMAGIADFDIGGSGSTILPGAICEHLTSFGGIMREGGGQTPLTEFIRAGAAGASGTVHEPYSIQAKFPDPMIHVHYARGCSLAESFYQSVAGPYQLLIVGDPLCAPWAQSIDVALDGPRDGETVRGTVDLTPRVPDGVAVKQVDLFLDGRLIGRVPTAEVVHVDTTIIADGFHEFRFVVVAADGVEAQSRAVRTLLVDNSGWTVDLDVQREEVGLAGVLKVRASAPGAERIEIHHHGRPVGTIEGEAGLLDIDAGLLGLGTSMIQALAQFPEPAEGTIQPVDSELRARLGSLNVVRSEPVEIHVTSPPQAAAVRGIQPAQLERGFILRTEGGVNTIIDETRDPTWLTTAGARDNEEVTIEGYFRAAEPGLYQLQIQTPREVTVEVDGATIATDVTSEWQFFPLSLRAGPHHLRITLRGEGPPRLDARFGLAGTRPIDGTRLRHRP